MISRVRLPVLGLDGGRNGAIAMLESPTKAMACLRWTLGTRHGRRVYNLRGAILGEGVTYRATVGSGFMIGRAAFSFFGPFIVMAGGKAHIGAEDLFIPRNGKGIKSTITLAKFVGALAAPLEPWDPSGEAEWFVAPIWRKPILGLGHFTKREVAKEASLRIIPTRIAGVGELELALRGRGGPCNDITDAFGVAAHTAMLKQGASW